jgi:hypothetical protein
MSMTLSPSSSSSSSLSSSKTYIISCTTTSGKQIYAVPGFPGENVGGSTGSGDLASGEGSQYDHNTSHSVHRINMCISFHS